MSETLVQRAERIARAAHAGQVDKSGVDYIKHPERIATRLLWQTGDEIAAAVAWLHDVIEDTDITTHKLRSLEFPDAVVDAVRILTRHADGPETYKEFIQRIATSGNMLAIRVKLADLEDNMARGGIPEDMVRKRYAPAHAVLTNVLMQQRS